MIIFFPLLHLCFVRYLYIVAGYLFSCMSFLSTAMTSLGRNLTTLLLFLNLSPFLLHLFTHAVSVQPPVTRKSQITYMTLMDIENEYENYGEDLSSPPEEVFPARTTVLRKSRHFCKYDSCLENQEPCIQIASRTGCLCPGVSGPDLAPHAPRLREFLTVAEGEHTGSIEVHWCAPSSVVSKYKVVVEKSDKPALEFSHTSRRGLVGSLEPGDKVCVLAVNNAGSSSPSEHSCSRYEHHSDISDSKLLIGLIGGGITLLVLIIVVSVILVKFKACKRMKNGTGDGLGNPSFSTVGTLWSRTVLTRPPPPLSLMDLWNEITVVLSILSYKWFQELVHLVLQNMFCFVCSPGLKNIVRKCGIIDSDYEKFGMQVVFCH